MPICTASLATSRSASASVTSWCQTLPTIAPDSPCLMLRLCRLVVNVHSELCSFLILVLRHPFCCVGCKCSSTVGSRADAVHGGSVPASRAGQAHVYCAVLYCGGAGQCCRVRRQCPPQVPPSFSFDTHICKHCRPLMHMKPLPGAHVPWSVLREGLVTLSEGKQLWA